MDDRTGRCSESAIKRPLADLCYVRWIKGMKIPHIFRKTTTWVWASVILLMAYHIGKLFAVFGPLILIALIAKGDNSLTLSAFYSGFDYYNQLAANTLNIAKDMFLVMAAYSALMAFSFLTVTPFLLKHCNWARQVVLFLVTVEILSRSVLSVYYKTVTSLESLIFYVVVFIFFLWPSVVIGFKKHNDKVQPIAPKTGSG